MTTEKIVQTGDEVLRQKATAVTAAEFGTPELARVLKNMSAALELHDDGVALAAPQIGVSKRIYIVSRKIFEENPPAEDLIFINPRITGRSRKKVTMEEGCLSVRWIYGEVKRHEKVTVAAQDFDGTKFTRHASGLLAQIFQHEIDHLDGVLFTDQADNLQEIHPEDLHEHAS